MSAQRYRILIDGQRVDLTPMERLIFIALFNARRQLVLNDELQRFSRCEGRALRVHICRMRKKLAPTLFRIYQDRSCTYRMDRLPELIQVAA